jgi:N-hydroxyarylamine O-acetyltransferase
MNRGTVTDPQSPFDLDAYFRRIGYEGPRQATLAVLTAIAEHHTLSIPFENLDILLGRPIHLGAASLEAKLVRDGRGGYCFEHNTLMAGVLRQLGFDVAPRAARVRWMLPPDVIGPRTHMLLAVKLGGERWLVDGGFGALGVTAPLRMDFDGEQASRFEAQRLVTHASGRVLQARVAGEWQDLYSFTDEPTHPIDFEVANWFTSTHPGSRFTHNLIVTLASPGARHVLFNRELTVYRDEGIERKAVDDPDQLLELLASTFHLQFAPGTRVGSTGGLWAR